MAASFADVFPESWEGMLRSMPSFDPGLLPQRHMMTTSMGLVEHLSFRVTDSSTTLRNQP